MASPDWKVRQVQPEEEQQSFCDMPPAQRRARSPRTPDLLCLGNIRPSLCALPVTRESLLPPSPGTSELLLRPSPFQCLMLDDPQPLLATLPSTSPLPPPFPATGPSTWPLLVSSPSTPSVPATGPRAMDATLSLDGSDDDITASEA